MKKIPLGLLLAFYFFPLSILTAQSRQLHIEKEPLWVTLNNIDYNSNKLEAEAEDGYIDLAYEKQVALSQQSRYYRKVIKILSEAGVQNSSEIALDYEPSYQQLVLHKILIIRNGLSINKMQLSKFKIIQQETDLSRHTYNGTLTALLLLEDVRKGDIIEYSYTIKGSNPIFNGKYSDFLDTRYTVPIGNLYYKVIVPTGRKINIKTIDAPINPIVKQTLKETVYEWRFNNVAPLHPDSRIPEWYNPFPTVYLSEYNNWSEVNNWAMNLFPVNMKLSAGLQKKVDNIFTTNTTNETRTLAALHFVQDDIRYMGIELGIGTHKPANPNKVFAQRFGDCKDKSYLLVTMLRAMGIKASPILINTTSKKVISTWLPTPSAFDHVTVKATVDGYEYYFDPTISFQRGSIKDISYPDYQTGLVITDTTTSLASISYQQKGKVSINEIFTIPSLSGDAQLKVITHYTGSYADDIRDDFKNNSLFELKKKYRNFYGEYYEKITADSLLYNNDDNTGEFITNEFYTISEIWKNKKGVKKCWFGPYVINGVMIKPDDNSRTMPFYLTYPAHYAEDIEINLPEEWPVENDLDKVECASFVINSSTNYSYKRINLHYEYENLKDYVLPSETSEYLSSFKQVEEKYGYTLSINNGHTVYSGNSESSKFTASSPGNIYPKLYFLLGLAVVITFFVKRNKSQKGY